MNIISVVTFFPLLVVLTNMITNVFKGLCKIFERHARVIAPVVAELLTLAATAAYLQYYSIQQMWYWYAGGAVAGGVVAYVSMNGYDGLYQELLDRLHGLTDGKKHEQANR